MTAPADFLSRARRAIEEATQLPWEEGGPYPTLSVIYQTAAGYSGPDGGAPPEYDAVCIVWQSVDSSGRMVPLPRDYARRVADRAVIVLAVNSLSSLLDVYEAAKTLRAALAPDWPLSCAHETAALDSAITRLEEC